jgi:hypothetical protein
MHIKLLMVSSALALAYSLSSANAQEVLPQPPQQASPEQIIRCNGNSVKQTEFRWYVKRVYKREIIRKVALKKLDRMRYCSHSIKANKNMLRLQKAEGRKRRARILAARIFPVRPHLKSIAQCESHGNPQAISPNGMYRGKYQFSFSTWQSVGGKGDPAAASEYEQDKRAEMLYKTGGPGHWPVCQSA